MLHQVLEYASPWALSIELAGNPKRQRTAALQDAGALAYPIGI